ncbi:hypothetical protein LSCM1_05410 [Leishmania martiniquensis]|uniref:Uncharacterized protein n=1 Tax=Leishmania martiniquensis TaxID=1580590 RepID=A0A836HHR3_9TRYP|nr:hypothetical protein LSCM1_05410 [Leishmania martiniquensis]
MNLQPFRVVRPLSRILHRTMLQVLRENQQTLPVAMTDTLITYSLYEQVPHAELLEALLTGMAKAQHGDVALSSDQLFVPLKGVRRALSGVQQFPFTTAALATLKREAEVKIVRDTTRLSTEDLSSTDVGLLWGLATQCSHWDCVEELLQHFPLSSTLDLQSAKEYRDLLMNVCTLQFGSQSNPRRSDGEGDGAAAPAQRGSAAPSLRHAEGLIERVLGAERVWQRCREALVASSLPLIVGGGSMVDSTALEERDIHAFACVMYSATLELQCNVPADSTLAFPFSEAEWMQYVGGVAGSSSIQCAQPITIGGLSLPVWYRRVVALHQRSVPEVVRTSFAAAVVNDLLRLYRRIDTESLEFFFRYFLPMVADAAPHMDCRNALRSYHNGVMAALFGPLSSASAATSETGDLAAATGQRGKWTTTVTRALAKPASATKPASSALSSDMAMRVMLAEVCVQEKGKPLPEGHVPAMQCMLRTVLQHLRHHLQSASRSCLVPPCTTTAAALPESLWSAWSSHRTSVLATVLSELQERMSGSAGQGSSATALASLVGEGLQLLRPLLSMEVIDERGTARMVTSLLSSARGAALEIGGAPYEAELQSFALQHVHEGFGRADVASIVKNIEAHCCRNGGAAGRGDTKAQSVLEGLKAAELSLPLRSWS